MAQKVNIVLVDDIDHTDADETVSFGLDGKNYEIDLNTKNATALREALALYVGHARRSGGTTRRAAARGTTSRQRTDPLVGADGTRRPGDLCASRGTHVLRAELATRPAAVPGELRRPVVRGRVRARGADVAPVVRGPGRRSEPGPAGYRHRAADGGA